MLTINRRTRKDILIGAHPLSLAELRDIAVEDRPVRLTDDPIQLRKLETAAALVDKAVTEAWPVYGVTTGFGSAVSGGDADPRIRAMSSATPRETQNTWSAAP